MIHHRTLAALAAATVLLLALAFVLAPRGNQDGSERIVIRFLDRPDRGGAWQEIIQRFEAAHPDIHVELVEGPTATDNREDQYVASMLSGSSPYDLVYMDVIWVPKFASQGWLLPLDERLPAAERERFLPGDIRGSIYDGRLWRLPVRSDAGMLYYRKDLVASPPETFEELEAAARAAQTPPNVWGLIFQGKQYEGLVCAFLEVLWGHGGDVLDERGEVVLDRPEGVRALTWLAGQVGKIVPEGVTTYEEEESRHLFQQGKAVFLRNWPYVWSKAQEDGSPVRGKVGIVPMVHAPGCASAATLGGWGFGIVRTSPNPDAAWAFASFATEPAQQKILHFRAGAIPARIDLFADAEILAGSPHYPDLLRVLKTARPRPVHPRYARISDALQRHVSAALVGGEKPEDAIRLAAEEIRQAVRN